MNNETISILATDSETTLNVVVYSKRVDQIEVVIGEGIHSTKCKLRPTESGIAYVGNVMGREVVYQRSTQQVQNDIDESKPSTRRR